MNTDELITALSEDAQPGKRLASPFTLFAYGVMLCVFYMVLLLLFFGVRDDLMEQFESPLFSGEIISLALMLISALFSAAALSFPDMHQKYWLVWLPALPFFMFITILYASWLNDIPPSPRPEHAFLCLLCMVSFSLLPALAALYILHQYATTHYRITAVIALLSSASLGSLTLRLSEKTDSIAHIVTWHYLPMLGFSLLGVWIGKQCLKW